MKKISWLLIVILAVACDEEPTDSKKTSSVAHLLGEYQSIRRFECNDTPNCASLVQDSVLRVTKGTTDSTISVMGYEVQIDKDGKFFCCEDFNLFLQNDTLKTSKKFRLTGSTYVIESFVGVKGVKSPLKAGTVGFRSASYESSENGGTATIFLGIEGAKFGAAIIIEILNTSTGVYGKDFITVPGAHDNKIVVTVGPNVPSAIVELTPINDLIPNTLINTHFQISDKSVGITPSEKRSHSYTIVEDSIGETSVNKIVFSGVSIATGYLFEINSDGTALRKRTGFPSYKPSFSPDGGKLVFIGNQEIYSMNYNGHQLQQLTNNNLIDDYPSFSPQGDKILFVREVRKYPVDYQIFTMNTDGTGETQISQIGDGVEAIDIMHPSWSPDGKEIVFSCNIGNEGVGYRIYKMSADGSNVTRLAHKSRWESHPRFSPDGQKIIFNVFEPSGMGYYNYLYLINSDGTGEEKLFSGIPGLSGEDAEWSPDGSTIVFLGSFQPYGEVTTFTARIDGSDLKQITQVPLYNASWSPAK